MPFEKPSLNPEIEAENWHPEENGSVHDKNSQNNSGENSDLNPELEIKSSQTNNDRKIIKSGIEDDQENNQNGSKEELKNYFVDRFKEILAAKLDHTSEISKKIGVPADDKIKTFIVFQALKELAGDPKMPIKQGKLLKVRINSLDFYDIGSDGPEPDEREPHSDMQKMFRKTKKALKKMSLNSIMDQLKDIFPENFISYLKSL